MSPIGAVMATQRKLFFRDKGMLLFYALGILALGGVFPLFFPDITPQLTLAMFLCVTMQKQWTAESVAGEREGGTLESLMASPLPTRACLLGKALFNLTCAAVYALCMMACTLAVRRLINAPAAFDAAGWAVCGLAALSVLALTACYGVLCSARAETVQLAGRGPTVVCYLFSLLFIVLLTVLTPGNAIPVEATAVIAALFFLSAGGVIVYSLVRLLRMGRSEMIEVARRVKHAPKRSRGRSITNRRHTHTWSVFVHEMQYLKTQKLLLLNFGILILCPAGLQYTLWIMLGVNDLHYAVLLTILIIPRIPTNLIAYSVGGEKAYKTGESILSTPVSISALFWGKAAVPCLVSVLLLVFSAALNLAAANILAGIDGAAPLFYDATQLVLLFGVGLATGFIMIIAAAIFSLKAKTPRKGLYYSTFLGLVFFVPAAVLHLLHAGLPGALGYLGVLAALAVWLYRKVHHVSRAALMASL